MSEREAGKSLLFLVTGLERGGAERQVVDLAIEWKRRGWTVTIVSMIAAKVWPELEQASIPVITLNMRRGVPDPRALFRLRTILNTLRPDIVHSHMVHANILARITRLFCRMQVLVCTTHSIHEGGTLREFAYRATSGLDTFLTTICQAALDTHLEKGIARRGKSTVVYNGVRLQTFSSARARRTPVRQQLGFSTEFVWLTAGRLDRAKDYPNLLRAFAQVYAQQPNARLIIAGEGDLRPELESLIERLKLRQAVRLLGVRNDVPELMGASDAFVLGSAWEGLSLALLEASLAELPIVATDVGGTKEIVNDGCSGYLVQPRDSQELAKRMVQIMALSPAERNAMGRAGADHVRRTFDMNKIMDEWNELYTRLLAESSTASSLGRTADRSLGS